MTMVIELSVSSIDDEAVARPLLRLLEEMEFGPRRYDLNERGSWRAWDLDAAVVDLLTQRTQMFRVEGSDGTAVIATGKNDETPTMIIETETSQPFDERALRGLPVAEFRQA